MPIAAAVRIARACAFASPLIRTRPDPTVARPSISISMTPLVTAHDFSSPIAAATFAGSQLARTTAPVPVHTRSLCWLQSARSASPWKIFVAPSIIAAAWA
jgi:hypothetical protein